MRRGNPQLWDYLVLFALVVSLGGCGNVVDNSLSINMEIEDVVPGLLPSSGGVDVSVLGQNFELGTTVTIGGATVAAQLVSENRLRFTAPVLPIGPTKIEISNTRGETVTADIAVFADVVAFASTVDFAALGEISDAVAFDYDNDGLDDLVVLRRDGMLTLLHNAGDARFRTPGPLATVPTTATQILATGDLDGDLHQDIVTDVGVVFVEGEGALVAGHAAADIIGAAFTDVPDTTFMSAVAVNTQVGLARRLLVSIASPIAPADATAVVTLNRQEIVDTALAGTGLGWSPVAFDVDGNGVDDVVHLSNFGGSTALGLRVRFGPTFASPGGVTSVNRVAPFGFDVRRQGPTVAVLTVNFSTVTDAFVFMSNLVPPAFAFVGTGPSGPCPAGARIQARLSRHSRFYVTAEMPKVAVCNDGAIQAAAEAATNGSRISVNNGSRLARAHLDRDGHPDLLYIEDGRALRLAFGSPNSTTPVGSVEEPSRFMQAPSVLLLEDASLPGLTVDQTWTEGISPAGSAVSNFDAGVLVASFFSRLVVLAAGDAGPVVRRHHDTSLRIDELATCDVDADGVDEVIAANANGRVVLIDIDAADQMVETELAAGSGQPVPRAFTPGLQLLARDISGDGACDIVLFADGTASAWFGGNGLTPFNDAFAAVSASDLMPLTRYSALDADLDGDIDLVALGQGPSHVLLTNDGTGTFSVGSLELPGTNLGRVYEIVEAEQGRWYLLSGEAGSRKLSELMHDGSAWTVAQSVTFARGDAAEEVADERLLVGDINGDGQDDFMIVPGEQSTLHIAHPVLRGGDGFTALDPLPLLVKDYAQGLQTNYDGFRLIDLNGDGLDDLVGGAPFHRGKLITLLNRSR